MLKVSSITFLVTVISLGQVSTVSSVPFSQNRLDLELFYQNSKISPTLVEHAKDFLQLIDLDKVLVAAIPYLNDPEVQKFVAFVLSDEFKNIIWEFETMVEFKEAFALLADKGYDVETVINLINVALQLPPFENTNLLEVFSKKDVNIKDNGMNGFIENVIAVLPLEDMKALFESKLETSPEVAELFETINSQEFLEIMRKMSKNPKFIEIKKNFAGYGFDFKYLCTLAKNILGEYYQGVFCED